jgi:uncharacterized protein YukE
MSYPLSVDDPGIQAVLTAFQNADGVVKGVQTSVSAAEAALQWSGDASTTYKNSLAGWLDGLRQVQTAMQMMDDAMGTHLQSTNVAEESNTGSAGWWR